VAIRELHTRWTLDPSNQPLTASSISQTTDPSRKMLRSVRSGQAQESNCYLKVHSETPSEGLQPIQAELALLSLPLHPASFPRKSSFKSPIQQHAAHESFNLLRQSPRVGDLLDSSMRSIYEQCINAQQQKFSS